MSTFWVTGGVEEEEEATPGEAGVERESGGKEEPRSALGQAWEIDFGSSDSKPKKLPRFLSKTKPQTQTVVVKASPANQQGKQAEKSTSKPLSSPSRPTYKKTTPTHLAVKPKTASSAPAKTSGKFAMASVSSKSSIQSRASTAKSSASGTPSSSRLTPATVGRGAARNPSSSLLTTAARARPASAPSSAHKTGRRNSSGGGGGLGKSIFSKKKSNANTPAGKEPGGKSGGRKLSVIWKKRGSKDKIKTEGGGGRRESSEKGSESGGVFGGGSRIPQSRGLPHRSPGMSRSSTGRGGGRVSAGSKKSSAFQSSGGDVDDGWGCEEGDGGGLGGATDERGFETSGATRGSWALKQQENFERLRSEQFSPRLQTTPDIPNSRATRQKLKEVQRWVHEVTIHTNEAKESLEGGGREIRMALVPEEMAGRKVLDLRRWYCMSRPQYSRSCGISSVVSCWNFIFSTLGNGSLPPMTQEEALSLLGFKPPFGEIKFGPFTGNATVMRWFKALCNYRDVSGKAYCFYKAVGRGRTFGVKPQHALASLKEGLQDPHTAFIYHCWNHYFCPIGFEEVPRDCQNAYSVGLGEEEVENWILIGEPSRKQPSIHCKKWDDIVLDLTCESPQCFNIRHPERGVQTRHTTKRPGGNLHCIMAFTMQESGEWGTTDNSTSPEPHAEMSGVRNQTPIETLDSSESDFPIGGENPSRQREENDGIETLTREDAAKLCIWSDGTTSPTSSLERDEKEGWHNREAEGLVGRGSEGVVGKEVGSLVERENKGTVEDVDTADFGAKETTIPITPRTIELIGDLVPGDVEEKVLEVEEEEEEDDTLNKTLTPRKDGNEESERTENVLEINMSDNHTMENQPSIEINRSETPDRHFVRRGATYRKTRSSLSPVPVAEVEGGQQLEGGAAEDEPVMTGDYTRRSGTFRKEKSSLSPVPAIVAEVEGGQQLEGVDDPVMAGDYTRRSGTFRKEKPSLPTAAINIDVPDTRNCSTTAETNTTDLGADDTRSGSALQLESVVVGDGSLEAELTTNQESGLKRSSTFRKEKPTLEVSPIRRDSDTASQHSDQDRDFDTEFGDVTRRPRSTEPPTQSSIPIPAVSLTLPPNTVPLVAYTADSDDDSSVEESYLLVDDDPGSLGGRGVRRSGTFTKERPNTLFGDDYF